MSFSTANLLGGLDQFAASGCEDRLAMLAAKRSQTVEFADCGECQIVEHHFGIDRQFCTGVGLGLGQSDLLRECFAKGIDLVSLNSQSRCGFVSAKGHEMFRALAEGGVKIDSLIDDPSPVRRISDPGNPLADKDGFVYLSNVNEMTEMVEMMAASRSYQNNVEVINTTRQLMMRTIEITRS